MAKIASEDVDSEMEKYHSNLKRVFKLKHKDIKSEAGESGGAIITPHFEFDVWVRQNPDDASQALWRRELKNIQDPELLLSDEFNAVFDRVFDRVVFSPLHNIELAKVIDRAEAADEEEISIDTSRDGTECTILMTTIACRVRITRDSIEYIVNHKSPKRLIEAFFKAHKMLVESLDLGDLLFPTE